ncbi:S41 family peptidase [Bernardetia sp.]|uniref:S41 family peptidase n=1 Tax=Bernardetia sp. TaxID=1937974 RepID=UPI0025C039E7|nr:S41 family peptidase [Bernardetia sp.]
MYKTILAVLLTILLSNISLAQVNEKEIEADLQQMINDISDYYVYLEDKNIELSCIEKNYKEKIKNIKTKTDVILLFENLLNEFYDSHLILNTNTKSSYRLYSPIYATFQNEKAIITNVWQTELENIPKDIIETQIQKINGIEIEKVIASFPTHCQDKKNPKVREWILNKILAGKYNEPRILTLQAKNNSIIHLDLDTLQTKKYTTLADSYKKNNIGVIKINNSLGNNNLIEVFDSLINQLMDTDGLIIDLRNTVDGGNSYVARAIMGRFINSSQPYQVHELEEQYDGKTKVDRKWVEYVNPRENQYKKQVVVLVGRWTGSMGEGITIGFDAMQRGSIVGTEMERLAGEMSYFPFQDQNFGYRLSVAKLSHTNGTPRENYVPTKYVRQTTTQIDETLQEAIKLLKK